ncbi:hypothetical protein ACR2E5_01570 [Acinetobacter baumannii]
MALKITKQGLGVIKNDPINLYNLENNPSQLDFQFNSLGDDKNLPLDQDEIKVINYVNKPKNGAKISSAKAKRTPIKSKTSLDLPMGPLFNFKLSEHEQKQLEAKTSKNFEKLRQNYRS